MTGSSTPHPLAHDALICVDAPGMAISPWDGQLRGHGVQGLFHDGRRLLTRSLVTIGGREPESLSSHVVGAGAARFLGMHRLVADPGQEPALVVDRTRLADGRERLVVRNTANRTVRVPVELTLGADLLSLAELRRGRRGPELPARVRPGGLSWVTRPVGRTRGGRARAGNRAFGVGAAALGHRPRAGRVLDGGAEGDRWSDRGPGGGERCDPRAEGAARAAALVRGTCAL